MHRPALTAIVVIAVIAALALGCSGPAGAPSSPPPATAAAAVATESAMAATPSATASDVAAASPSRSTQAGSAPPEATLTVEGGDPVTGQLGTYVWADGGSDSPWLPGAPIKAGAGEALTATLADEVGVAGWTARRVPAGTEGGAGASELGSGSAGPVTFSAPDKGVWSVQVDVEFADGLGSASYYWQLEVT